MANSVSSLPLPTLTPGWMWVHVAGQDELAVAPLHAQPLGLGVPAVAGGAHAFLMGEKL